MGAASLRRTDSADATDRRQSAGRTGLKLAVLVIVLISLGVIVGFSLSRELDGTLAGTASSTLRVPSRPALTSEEQAYLEALWPIHTNVEVAAERVALGAIFYKTSDLDRTELKARLDEALTYYRAADDKLRQLHPPESMRTSHEGYLSAMSAFTQSTIEMLKMFDDGNEDHLRIGYPLYLDGTNRIRELGGKFWPDEFPPN